MNRDASERLDLYITPEHPCGYIDGRMARTVFVDPELAMDSRLYTLLATHGFRRNGEQRPERAYEVPREEGQGARLSGRNAKGTGVLLPNLRPGFKPRGV